MASLRAPSRLWPTLLAAVVLSALSAAEATLAAAPLHDATQGRGDPGDWPAQLTPVKDRDSANHRTVRPADSQDDRLAPPTFAGGVALFTYPHIPLRLVAAGVVSITRDRAIATARLSPHTIGLPPPIC